MMSTVTALDDAEMPTRNELRTAVLGGLIGGIVSSILLLIASRTVEAIAVVFGFRGTVGNGWGTYMLLALVFGFAFALVVTQLVDQYVALVVSLTSRYESVRKAVMPLTNRFGMRVVVTTAMGLIYGLALGVVFVVILIPLQVMSISLFQADPVGIIGFVLYGVILGVTYGTQVVN